MNRKIAIRFLGFTLSEVVVVTALLGVLMLFAVGIFIANNRLFNTQSGENLAIAESRAASDSLATYGRGATAVLASYIYNSVPYTSDTDTVIFRIPAIDSGGQIISATYDYTIITRDPNNASRLLLIVDPNVASARKARNLQLTDHLITSSFTYDSGDFSAVKNIAYEIRITYTGRNSATEQVYGAVTLRN